MRGFHIHQDNIWGEKGWLWKMVHSASQKIKGANKVQRVSVWLQGARALNPSGMWGSARGEEAN